MKSLVAWCEASYVCVTPQVGDIFTEPTVSICALGMKWVDSQKEKPAAQAYEQEEEAYPWQVVSFSHITSSP